MPLKTVIKKAVASGFVLASLAAQPALAQVDNTEPVARCAKQEQGPLVSGGVRMVEVNDNAWAYREKGSGPPVLLIQPTIGDSTLWLSQLNELKDIRRMIAPDLVGFGHSEPVPREYQDPYIYARELLCLLDALGVEEKVDLVGLSVGAFITGLMYELAPERINSITLVSGTFKFERSLPYERYQQENARNAVVEGRDTLFRRFDEYIRDRDATLTARARYKDMIYATPHTAIVASMYSNGQTVQRPDLPAKIDVPVMLPIGNGDQVFSIDRYNEMAADFPNATVVELDSAGRLLPLEAPEEFNRALREFWTGAAKR